MSKDKEKPIRVGVELYEAIRHWGRTCRVEALGTDWVVVRDSAGEVHLIDGDPDDLCKRTISPESPEEDD